ncbi:MAG: glycosyltransferase [Myxococcales bacterium]|nr:glycosyltransferase [Myxococcales bacterium]
MKISLIIPCFNEEESLPLLIQEIDAVIDGEGLDAEVLLIDDGSMDATPDLIRKASRARPERYKGIIFRRNHGQTAAMLAGMDHASGDVLVPLDADLQNPPSEIPKLLAKLEEGYDVVSGWRKDRQDKALTRKLPSRMANWLIGKIGGLPLHDYGCSLKAYRREVIQGVRLYGEMHRFIPIYAKWQGARVTELPVEHRARALGTSKYGLNRTFKVLLDLLTVKFLGDYGQKPIYFFGGLGMFLCGLGTLSAIETLVEKALWGVKVHTNPFIILAVFLFIVGVQAIMMGLLADLQMRTFYESQDKRTYLVLETCGLDGEAPEFTESPTQQFSPEDA